jgi:hypothetical protein
MMMTVMGESRAQVSSLFSSRLAQEEEDTWWLKIIPPDGDIHNDGN